MIPNRDQHSYILLQNLYITGIFSLLSYNLLNPDCYKIITFIDPLII